MRFFLQNTTYIHFANPSEALAKIDLMQKCIFAMLTFYKVKCSAQHLLAKLTFCLQNVRKRFAKEMYANRALQKSFSAQHLPFCVAVSSTIALQKCIFASGHFFSNNLAHFC